MVFVNLYDGKKTVFFNKKHPLKFEIFSFTTFPVPLNYKITNVHNESRNHHIFDGASF